MIISARSMRAIDPPVMPILAANSTCVSLIRLRIILSCVPAIPVMYSRPPSRVKEIFGRFVYFHPFTQNFSLYDSLQRTISAWPLVDVWPNLLVRDPYDGVHGTFTVLRPILFRSTGTDPNQSPSSLRSLSCPACSSLEMPPLETPPYMCLI